MMWLFAILVVVVLGAVAAVAAGRAGMLAEPERDRVPVVLPEGRLAAADLRKVRFPLALRGYRMAEVDAVLDRLAKQLDEREPESEPVPEPVPEPGDSSGHSAQRLDNETGRKAQ